MEINEGLDALQRAELVGDDDYDLRIVEVREETPNGEVGPEWTPGWGVASCEIIAANDPLNNNPETIGRRVDYWLFNRYGTVGLRMLIQHKHMFDPEGGWDQGIPRDSEGHRLTTNLVGVEFTAKVTSKQTDDGYKQNVRPIIVKPTV